METAPGRNRAWHILVKLGEGDAGEIYRVESLLDHSIAILKRPRRKAFPSDIIRQAAQIEKEAQILSALVSCDDQQIITRVPLLRDTSQAGSEYSDRYFIVLSPAAGISLAELYRAIRHPSIASQIGPASARLSPTDAAFIENIIQLGKLPNTLLLRVITGVIEYLETIHSLQVDTPKGMIYGVIWNDIKPDHFFWDPVDARLTFIDWGNAQFLEADGVTKDRQHSRMGDFIQLIDTLGSFILEAAPQLYQALEWPENTTPANVYSAGIMPLKSKAYDLLQQEEVELSQARANETDILQRPDPAIEHIAQLGAVHQEIYSKGEMPNLQGAHQFYIRLARKLIEAGDLVQFTALFELAGKMSGLDLREFNLLEKIGQIVQAGETSSLALLSALDGDWITTFWELRRASLEQKVSGWWSELSGKIRLLESGEDTLRPLTAINRALHALQFVASQSLEQQPYDGLIQMLGQSIIPRWTQLEPDPPNSGIEYSEVEAILEKLEIVIPESARTVIQALDQPRSQVRIALDAWFRQDFEAASRALRRILYWDPDRTRLMLADQALQEAVAWLSRTRAGPTNDEPLLDFITRQELTGRELRNQFAPAPWLDSLLEAFKQLRRGEEPTDVLIHFPEIRPELNWLISLEPRRPLLTSANSLLSIERLVANEKSYPTIFGIKEAPVGEANGILLGEALDAWTPEARGSSARIFNGSLNSNGERRQIVAIKIMRPDRVNYALPLFREEASILSLLHDVPGVISLIEAGFLAFPQSDVLAEDHILSALELRGKSIRYGLDSIHNFLADLDVKVEQGWIPYLAIQRFENKDNLLLHCDTGHTNGRFLPTLDGLAMAVQICDILDAAHARNIIYRDHKILHYYWRAEFNGIFLIDWNVSKRFPAGLSASETQFDLVQFGARALHYLLAGRAAPGALPLGPNKPEEIEAAAHSYTVQWNYDDRRLPKDIKDLLHSVLAGEYRSARQLRNDLHAIYQKLSVLVNKAGG